MKKLLTLLSENNLEETSKRAQLGNPTPKDLALLEEVATKTHVEIEGRLMQLESIARAVQVASNDKGNTGLFTRIDGFNLAWWLEEEAKTLQALFSIKSDYEHLTKNTKGAE